MTNSAPNPPDSYRIGLLANPGSGRHARSLGDNPPPNDIPTVHAQTCAEVGQALAQLAADGVSLIAVSGGDGTVRNVLTHILINNVFTTPPPIAIIASGSTNMTGHDTGTVDLERDGWSALQAFARAPSEGTAKLVRRSVLSIRPNPEASAFCGMVVGAGAIDYAVSYTQSRLHGAGLRGNVGPAIACARLLKAIATRDYRHFKPIDLQAEDDRGTTVDGATLLVVATTLERLLLGFRPFWSGGDGPVAWSAVASTARGMLRRLPGAAWGRPGRGVTPANGFTSSNTDSVRLSFDGGFVVDGERYTAARADGPVDISIAGTALFLSH